LDWDRRLAQEEKIEISAVTREYLQMLNLVTWTAVSAIRGFGPRSAE
jgi:hypothetical protein